MVRRTSNMVLNEPGDKNAVGAPQCNGLWQAVALPLLADKRCR